MVNGKKAEPISLCSFVCMLDSYNSSQISKVFKLNSQGITETIKQALNSE